MGAGVYPALAGSIFGSVVDNSWLRVDGGGTLLIDMSGTVESDPYENAPTIGGNGSLLLLEGSRLGLGVACSAAIAFSGPNATLELAAIPTGPIFNFAPGDQIQVDQTVTSMTYRQVTPSQAALTLADGAQTIGVLNVYGSFGGGVNAFHLDAAANGDTAVISLQSLQVAPTQQVWIQGGAGTDLLTATANGQILSTGGGSDTVSGGAFNGIDFYDFTVNFAGIDGTGLHPFRHARLHRYESEQGNRDLRRRRAVGLRWHACGGVQSCFCQYAGIWLLPRRRRRCRRYEIDMVLTGG